MENLDKFKSAIGELNDQTLSDSKANYSISQEELAKMHEENVLFVKQMRKDLDASLQKLKTHNWSVERQNSITKIQEAIMWLGMDLKRLGEDNPYPNSYNTANTKIEPTADGLKL